MARTFERETEPVYWQDFDTDGDFALNPTEYDAFILLTRLLIRLPIRLPIRLLIPLCIQEQVKAEKGLASY
jgi:hypothetical protein